MKHSQKHKHIVLITLLTLLALIKKSWRNFPKFYRNIGFISFLNAFYYYLCKRHLVWEFNHKGMNWRFLRGLHLFYVSPLLVLMFLSNFPNGSLGKKIIYFCESVVISMALEVYMVRERILRFKHGWNFYWSTLIYIKIYFYSLLFTKRPLLTTILSVLSMIFFIIVFKVPLTSRLRKGPFFLIFHRK